MIFFHKATNTLLVTDSVIHIPRDPPPVIDVEGLLQAAAEEGKSPLPDSPENRKQVGFSVPLEGFPEILACIASLHFT